MDCKKGNKMSRVLITGANRGLGLELARQYAARGDRVFAGCRSPQGRAALAEVQSNYPEQVAILPLDVVDEESLDQCVSLVEDEVDGLDILINNAAIYMSGRSLSEVRPEALLKLLHVNAVGAVMVAQRFCGLLKNGEHPRLVNISSEAGSLAEMTAFRGYGYYGSKTALNMYTRALAWDPELGGVCVIALHPGWVRTDMGGPDATLTAEESAAGILRVADGLKPEDAGKFYTWEGSGYAW